MHMRQTGLQNVQVHGLPLARNPLLQRHPVLVPSVLLLGALLVGAIALYSDKLFPWLTLLGITPFPFYLSIALASGLAGMVATAISLVEAFDRAPAGTNRKCGLPGDKGAALC
ncbi:hypothetical protein KSD_14260 [Ktedonobacter sp. SOSP1-85]|uniref:hypothetical protein n=1 Tax=Ktedonobacter sp. SOSP1-85 TaxID=2778367 RepID=UPI0019164FA7|nr:hypothetical protein [Ktedonobacter sp. SOSP1-85]GHO73655.1 hypothetical protein KSD_14260 [Ktedonobacter sp. SOSP1-85]